jgi:murein DD-endopeptidase MepM/ murein hydrolase activator NlpD
MVLKNLTEDVSEFGRTLVWYVGRKGAFLAVHVEEAKGVVVEILKARRGTYQKPFLHVGMVFLVLSSVGAAPVLIDRYPTPAIAESASTSAGVSSSILNDQTDITNVDTVTKESDKPRRDVVSYVVQGGDTLTSIAQKFSRPDNKIDPESIAYLNNFDVGKPIKPGEEIKIPPVSGVVVTVKSGDTIYSLAKKYGLPSAQGIVDWTYNTFVDDEKFTLAAGQLLVIPGGRAPEAPPAPAPKQINTTPFSAGSGQFAWPVGGSITQYFAFYHTGLDIAGPVGTAVVAADSGRVVSVLYENYGYGYHVIVDHGNGYQTLYGHLSRINVSVGQNVSRGEQLGLRGSTGRSTGPHLHFEVRKNGVFQNPMLFLH